MSSIKMNAALWEVIGAIPDYDKFFTLAELDASSARLAERYPDCVEFFVLGHTGEGRPITALKIGNGSKNALMFGCPHPNEPIGTMLLEHFSESLAKSRELRESLDYTFYIVKVWDADGYVRNEGWLKGPFTLRQYSRYFFRPAADVQVDWTFPIDYKELHFHNVMPETQAMKDLIDRIRPVFTYALHNAGFGGVYWYVTEDVPEIYDSLKEAAARQGIPLHLGEPESPSIPVLAPAVLLAEGIEAEYDYHEKYGAQNIAAIVTSGTCSDSYSKNNYGTFTLLTELPYFFDPRIADPTPTGVTRGEAAIERIDWLKDSNAKVESILARTRAYLSKGNPYLRSVEDNIREEGMDSARRMAQEDPEYRRLATQAEYFDAVWVNKFYRLLAYGMLIRAHEYELESPEISAEIRRELECGAARSEALHRGLADELEEEMNYEAIPIRKLVAIQLECGLKTALFLRGRSK